MAGTSLIEKAFYYAITISSTVESNPRSKAWVISSSMLSRNSPTLRESVDVDFADLHPGIQLRRHPAAVVCTGALMVPLDQDTSQPGVSKINADAETSLTPAKITTTRPTAAHAVAA